MPLVRELGPAACVAIANGALSGSRCVLDSSFCIACLYRVERQRLLVAHHTAIIMTGAGGEGVLWHGQKAFICVAS